MKLKITESNREAIATLLKEVNGRAAQHTASTTDIFIAAVEAEQKLASLGLTKAERVGSTAKYRSGGTVPASYKYTRVITHVEMARGSSAWYITLACTAEVWPNYDGNVWVTLTAEQDQIVVGKFRRQYLVHQTPAPVAVAS